MINNILTVCTGNICRSPLAEAQLCQLLPACNVTSAGIGALVYAPADANAQTVAQANHLDLTRHRGRQLTADMVRASDLLLVMEQHHADWITNNFPTSRGRVFLLGHWQDKSGVPDPFRQPLPYFEHAFEQIRQFCGDWVPRLGG